VVAAGPTTDMDVGTADGLLPGVADFDAASAWGAGDEVTTEIPDGADFDPTSLGSAWGDGNDATTVVNRGSGIGASADDDFLDNVVDFDAPLVWGGRDAATASSVTAARKRKGRGKHSSVAQDERKRQRRAALLLATTGDTAAGT